MPQLCLFCSVGLQSCLRRINYELSYEAAMNPILARLVDPLDILEHLKQLLISRGLGEAISYKDRIFKFTYISDPNVIFADDVNARSSVVFASEIRKVIEPLNYHLVVSGKGTSD